MKTATRTLMVLALALLLASPLVAGEKKKGGRGKKKPRPAPVLVSVPKSVELTDEQKALLAKINEEYAKEFAELTKKINLTIEQRKAGTEARKKAKEDGKKGKEAQEAVDAAMKLTDEQKAGQKEQQALRREAMQKFLKEANLTAEQKAKFPVRKRGGKKGKKKASE